MQELSEATAALDEALRSFKVTRDHFVADVALLGLATDVAEAARAVAEMEGFELCDRAAPIARTAFEATQLVLLLASDPDYDFAGARAWVYYLKVDRELAKRDRSTPAEMHGMSPDAWFEAAVEEMAALWDEMSAGKRELMARARATVEAQPKRPDNFLAVAIAPTLEQRRVEDYRRAGREAPSAGTHIFNNAYAALNRETHPRTRLRPLGIRTRGPDVVDVEFEAPDRRFLWENAAIVTAGAARLAETGVRRRMPAR